MIRDLLLKREDWDNTAVIENGQSFSYHELARMAIAVQKQLDKKPEENVALFLPNGREYIAALFGTFLSGITAFPINVQLTIHEITPLLAQASVCTVITSRVFAPLFKDISDSYRNDLQIIYIEDIRVEEDISYTAVNYRADEPMVLLSTSGTTANVKIVQLSDKNVEAAVLGFLSYIDYAQFDQSKIRYLLAIPFSSVYGILILSVCLIKSFPIVVTKGTLNLDGLYRFVEKYKVTHYEGGTVIPILMDQMSDRPVPYDISSLKFVGFGGSKVGAETFRRLAKAYPNIEFCQGYGMTESASLIARPVKKVYANKLDSVGTAIPGVTVAIDVNGTITRTPHTTGEIVVKGPNVMLGYYKNQEETNKTVKNGYLYTGDVGYLDEDGYLYLYGRKKNVIMVRGFSVYAEEVEACFLNSGLVDDCIVYGGTDAFGNEIVCIDLVTSTYQVNIDEIRLYGINHLAGYKQPQKIQIVEKIKKNTTGKSERRVNGTD